LEVSFHKEGVSLAIKSSLLKDWIKKTLKHFGNKNAEIDIIFCDDNFLKKINFEHLKHNYFTDVITFDYSNKQLIKGDIFISVDRVKDNAKNYKVSFNDELFRVIIHGFLHLCGFNDKTVKEKEEMRKQENFFLELNPCKSTA
jgi:rRNA maturation RNase YbeY